MKENLLWKPIALTVVLGAISIMPLTARAIEYGGFGGRPAYPRSENPRTESIFIHTLEPGSVQDEGVQLVNNSQDTKTLIVYATDSTPSSGGAFACKQMSEAKVGVGSWVNLAKSEVTLKAGTNEIVPFTISVPESASVGEHNGCILVQEKKDKTEQVGMNLSIRTGLRVAITIPGDISRTLEIKGFTVSKKNNDLFLLHPLVNNTGNVSANANVKVITRYFFGPTHFVHGGEYPILRGETSDWNFELAKPFWGGLFRSTFVVSYDPVNDKGALASAKELVSLNSRSVWFWSFPSLSGLIIEIAVLALILSLVFAWMISRRRAVWIKNNWVEYQVVEGDDIRSLAKRFDVSWKLLSKVNKLQAPYVLTAGEVIKVPPNLS